MFRKFKSGITGTYSLFKEITRHVMLKRIDGNYLSFSKSFNVTGYDEEEKCVFLNGESSSPLWGLEVSAYGNLSPKIDISQIAKNYKHSKSAKLSLFYTKTRAEDDSAGDDWYEKQSIYLFSQEKQLLEDIAYAMGIEWGIMSVDKLFQAFYDIGLINKYHTDKKEMVIRSRFHFTKQSIDNINAYFKMIFAEGIYGAISGTGCDKYQLYQGVCEPNNRYLLDRPDIYEIFKLPWHGYIAINYNFYDEDIQGKFKKDAFDVKMVSDNKSVNTAYKKAEEYQENIYDDGVIGNIAMLIDNPSVIKRLSKIINTTFVPKRTMRKEIIYATPITRVDPNYNFITRADELTKFIRPIHKKHNIPSRLGKNMMGRDMCGNFTSYSFSESGEGIHAVFVAPTRSGKTFKVLKIIQQSCGIEIVPKSEEEIIHEKRLMRAGSVFSSDKVVSASKLGSETKIVHFDKGYSAIRFISELKKFCPDKVHINSDDVSKIRYSLLNIEKEYDKETGGFVLKEDDILFSKSIIDAILTINNEEPLNISEEEGFLYALNGVFFDRGYKGATIDRLREIGGYDEVIERIYKRAEERNVEIHEYKTRTTDEALGLEGSDLDFMTKPTLSDVIKEISQRIQNGSTEEAVRSSLVTLKKKLDGIASMDIFAYYDQNNIHECDYYYFELNRLKDLGEKFFMPAFLITFNRLYRRDMAIAQAAKEAGREFPSAIYIIEEADSFIKVKVLELLFQVYAREASRFHMSLVFITQSPRDIPPMLLSNIHTRAVLSSGRIKEEDIVYFWGKSQDSESKAIQEENRQLAEFYMRHKKKFLTFVSSGSGVFTFQDHVSPSESRLFDSNGISKKEIDVTKIA